MSDSMSSAPPSKEDEILSLPSLTISCLLPVLSSKRNILYGPTYMRYLEQSNSETESRSQLPEAMDRQGKVSINKYKAAVWNDEHVLGMESWGGFMYQHN